jgi:hypothetical protein
LAVKQSQRELSQRLNIETFGNNSARSVPSACCLLNLSEAAFDWPGVLE